MDGMALGVGSSLGHRAMDVGSGPMTSNYSTK